MISGVTPVAILHSYRIDHAKSWTHSWCVTVQRRGRIYHRHYTDNVYGGKRKALDATKVYRDRLIARLRPMTHRECCGIKKKNNRSDISGVTRIDAKKSHRGKIRHRRYWLAQWPTENDQARMKKFSIQWYGE